MSAPVREVADAHRGSKKQRTLSVTGYGSAKDLHLRPCKHQVSLGKAFNCHADWYCAGADALLTCAQSHDPNILPHALQVAGHLFEGGGFSDALLTRCYAFTLEHLCWPADNTLSPVPGNDLWLCLCAEGKAGSLVDEQGHFYKPVQVSML